VNWSETVRAGLQAVRSHRLRSLLTVLGVLIGVAAVVLTVGLGEGAQASITARVSSLGSNLLTVSPGSTTSSSGVRGGTGSASTLTVQDATALSSHDVAPDISGVAPVVQRSESLTAGSANWTTTVVGTEPAWAPVRARTLAEGRFLTAADVGTHAAVAVLGLTTAQQLFGTRDALGQTVVVAATPVTVVGVLAAAGSSPGGQDPDDQAVLPITTAADRVLGGTNRTTVQTIFLAAASADVLSAADQEATAELASLHHVSAADADFSVSSQQSILDTITSITDTLTAVLAGLAGVSLLVGGIGVMNIMLVSVSERVGEIGLRKALGAAPRVIRRQFLVEAATLGLIGGLLGTLIGVLGSVGLSTALGLPVVVSWAAVVVAVVVAVGVGLISGVYPAGRAARLAPIDALRSE